MWKDRKYVVVVKRGLFFAPGDRGNCFASKHHAIAGLCAFNADIMGDDEQNPRIKERN